jgi:nitrite reductase/ring-hydroxylating ferredoxin subunit
MTDYDVDGILIASKLEAYEVQCPWYRSRLDIRTGKVARLPAFRSEPTYEIKIEDDNILVKKRAN